MFKGKVHEISPITTRLLMFMASDSFSVFCFVFLNMIAPWSDPAPGRGLVTMAPAGRGTDSASGSQGFHCKVNKVTLTADTGSATHVGRAGSLGKTGRVLVLGKEQGRPVL